MTARTRDGLTWSVLAAVLVGVAAAWAWTTVTHSREPADAAALAMPDFALTEGSGRTVTLADLLGRPWVADFIFTRCGGPCPMLSTRMAELQREFAGCDVRFVSFSVDPRRDTPEVLREYAERYEADPQRWWFLTGDPATIYDLANHGLKLTARPATKTEREQGADPIIHSTRFVLVDSAGRVAKTFVGIHDDEFAALRAALRDMCDGPEP